MTRFTQNDVLDEVVDVFDPGLQLVVAVAIVDDKLLLLDSQQPGVSGRDVKRDRVQPRLTANPRPDAARHHGQQGAADDRGAIGQPAPHAASGSRSVPACKEPSVHLRNRGRAATARPIPRP